MSDNNSDKTMSGITDENGTLVFYDVPYGYYEVNIEILDTSQNINVNILTEKVKINFYPTITDELQRDYYGAPIWLLLVILIAIIISVIYWFNLPSKEEEYY